MQSLILLSSVLMIQAGVVKENENCSGVFINNEYYEAETLKTDLDRPFLLAMDYSRNTLFFSYSVTKDDDVFKTAYVSLNSKEFGTVPVENGFAQAVDQQNHHVYVGNSEGIYVYDQKTKKAEFYGGKGADIWSLYFKDVVYYSDFPQQFLYQINKGQSVRVSDLEDTKVDHFIIDYQDVFYYTNHTGLYSQKKGTKDAVLYQEFPKDGVRGISLDLNGNVYVCVQDGIYRVDTETVTLKKVVDLEDAFGLAFDNENHILYSDATSVYRLKPNKEKSCTKN